MTTPWRSMSRDERIAWAASHWRHAVPALLSLAALATMSFPLFTPTSALPHLALLAVLVWALFRPALMPPWVALPVGLATDAALGLPLGVNTTLMPLAVIAVAAIDRRFARRPFLLDWALAAILILGYQVLSWQLLVFVLGDRPMAPLIVQAATTVVAYPPTMALMARVQRRLVVA